MVYKFYGANGVLVMQTTKPEWIKWDKKVKSFKRCEYSEREGVVIIESEENNYNASIEGHIVHPNLPVVRMVIE